jgi:SAM-dependent methyltransferase
MKTQPLTTASYAAKTFIPQYGCIAKEKARITKMVKFAGNGTRVLDVGCNDGSVGALLIKKDNEVFGIEASPTVAELAVKKGLKVLTADLEKGFPFEDAFFDVVMAGEIIEHISDTDFLIEEVKRVLKHDGIFVLSTPNVASLGRRIMLLLGKNPYFEASFGFPLDVRAGHLRFFTKTLLCDFLVYKGFSIEECTSDEVNFTSDGKFASTRLADIFPSFGRSIIVKTRKL